MPLPAVEPMPPRAGSAIPWLGAGIGLLRDPTGFFATARQRLGDTFLADAFGYRLLCVFSPDAVRRLYELPEADASKGLADMALLRLKLPDELMLGRRMRPHDLFGGEEVETYLGAVRHAADLEVAQLGERGTFDAFALGRRLGQRIGLACWAGPEAASPRHLERLLPLLDRLDASDAFVRPAQGFAAWATGKRRERAAVAGIERVIGEILAERARDLRPRDDFLARIAERWSDATGDQHVRGVARDVVMLHMGAQSNLPAALAWTLVDLLAERDLYARVTAGDDPLLERCASESIRLAQRSITLRLVRREIEVDDGRRAYRVAPGVFLTTMLSVTNATAAPGLDRYDPAHFDGRRLVAPSGLPARELVSTFGHGRHACPAQRFSISAIRIAVRALVERFALERLDDPEPRRAQVGGVARGERPCRVAYRARDGA
ncbi:MAG TPA: cytochrome [Candidatus Binatia bacterium]|nr:cytochrome [Candidatus Binatia bacterium]